MNFFSWESFVAMILGSVYGAVFGALPGLTATLALSLFIPIAIFLEPGVAFSALIGITATAIFAGDIGAVAVRIPGTPASAAYTDEIYEIGQKRSPAYALGIASIPSALGSLIGVVFLVGGSLVLAQFAKQFSSFEYFWLVLLGVISGVFATPNLFKGLIAFAIGMLLATIGFDPALGTPRFTFGNTNLLGGFDFIVGLIALFGVGEVLLKIYGHHGGQKVPPLRDLGRGHSVAREFFVEAWLLSMREKWRLLRSSLLGTFIGFLPGAGSDLAAWVSSNFARMTGANREQVALEGTASNNAAIAGTWIPALALGIPGDTLTAIVLGMFLALGITPGPSLFADNFGFVMQIYSAFFFVSVLVMPLAGYMSALIVNRMMRIPMPVLLAGVLGLCLVGTYAINRNPFDLYLMVVLGVFGFAMHKGGFPLGQLILGLVLGPLLEQYLMVSLIKTQWDLTSFFSRPVAIGLAVANVLLVAAMIWLRWRQGRMRPMLEQE
jgi:putative tricarboxylic transport membrane protein